MGFYFSAHPLDEYQSTLEKLRAQSWADFQLAVKASGQAPGILGGTVSSIQYRKTKRGKRMGIVMLSDATGQFEAVLFDEQLEAASDLLQPGKSLVLNVVGEDKPEGVSLRMMMIRGIDDEAARTQYLLNVFLRDAKPLQSIASHLGKQGEGVVNLVVIDSDGDREVEIELPGKRLVSPQIANALKAVEGVVHAEQV